MFKKMFFLMLFLIPNLVFASPPVRLHTYTSGEVIDPSDVTENEDAIFNYLSNGVDTYSNNSITGAKILDGTIENIDISGTAGIIYSKLSLTDSVLNADIVSGAGIVDSKLATITTTGKVNTSALVTTSAVAGDVLYHNGTNWVRLGKDAGKYLKSGASAVSWDTPGTGDMLYADSRAVVYTTTRDSAGDSGDVAYTGIGFTPKAVIFMATHSYNFSLGYDDITTQLNSRVTGTTPAYGGSEAVSIGISDGTNTCTGEVKTFDASGFTITWTKTNSPTGEIRLNCIVFR